MNKSIPPKVLVVEDEPELRTALCGMLASFPAAVEEAPDGVSAINSINKTTFDLVLLDLELPRVGGLEVLDHVKGHSASTPVVILTGVTDARTAVQAMKRGAYDYLMKPYPPDELRVVVAKALEFRALKRAASIAERSVEYADPGIVGNSPIWMKTLEKAQRFAESDSLIFLHGETGCGKEVVARYIHRASARNGKAFVTVDCGVIPHNLIESELFGHQKGAFTGADQAKEGLVELASGGTLFLDEIGHIDAKFQQGLLKFVETNTFRRVGDTKTRSVDVRIVAATNQALDREAEAGRFRADLWYRLNGMRLDIPPLRERNGDIMLLAEFYLKRLNGTTSVRAFSSEAASLLMSYPWPGNVRELKSAVQRALAIARGERITPDDLGLEAVAEKAQEEAPAGMPLRQAEKIHILKTLDAVGGNISEAARVLGIGRNTLHAKLKEFRNN